MTISVDLGGGSTPRNPFNAQRLINVDSSVEGPDVIKCLVGFEELPLEDSSVEFVTAYDFLEHLPRVIYKGDKLINPFINAMNDVWRILKPGGVFFASTPAYPHPHTFQDPTHVNIITDGTYKYFTKEHLNFGRSYGFIGNFIMNKQGKTASHVIWDMTAVK